MKRRAWIVGIVLFFLCRHSLPLAHADGGRLELGPKVAVSQEKYARSSSRQLANDAYKSGISFGAVASYHFFDRISLQGEILYATRGGKIVDNGDAAGTYRLGYIELPALARVEILKHGRLSGHLIGGPALSYLLSAEIEESTGPRDIQEFLRGFDVGGVVGVQGAATLTPWWSLHVEARYDFGLLDVDTGTNDLNAKNRAFLLTLGVIFAVNDKDGDRIVGDDDGCPSEAEDKDGFEDLNGCPEEDNDQDKIVDESDRCPIEAETVNDFNDEDGCPERDGDADGFVDEVDTCPDERAFGSIDKNGCPPWHGDVRITQTKLEPKQPITFGNEETEVTEEHRGTLDAIALVLKYHPTMRLRLEGHAHSEGKEETNQRVSEDRARAVFIYLVEKGIKPDRLVDHGYGERQRISREETPEGKRKNRRVEFVIIEK